MIEVPCGHCAACKDTRRLGWFVRLYYEWQYCQDSGGFSLFETLTYNNEHLPYVFGNIHLYPCFSKRHIQLYLKKIRSKIKRSYPKLDLSNKIKYFVSMELGGKTHRPHYHIVFFVSSGLIRPFDFKYIVENLWHENGFTKQGKLNNGFVVNAGGLSYCAKYVCKDLYEEKYFNNLAHKLDKMGYEPSDYMHCFPHNMQSSKLGIYALEFDKNNDLDNFLKGEIFLPDKDNEIRKYKLPLYYERKIFYDTRYRYFDNNSNNYISVSKLSDVPSGCDYTPIYVLNDLGMEMKEHRAQKSLDAITNVYRVVLSLPELDTFLDLLNKKFNKNYESIAAFQQHIKKSLPEAVFVSYGLVYRGCKPLNDCSPSPCGNNNSYLDWMLIHDMSRGIRPLSVDFDNLCYNINYFLSLPDIEDNFQMIRYLYFLVHLEKEHIFNENERLYIEQKTAHLARTENILLTS